MGFRQTDRQTDKLGFRQTDKWGFKQTDKKTNGVSNRQTGRQIGVETDRQTDKWGLKPTDRQNVSLLQVYTVYTKYRLYIAPLFRTHRDDLGKILSYLAQYLGQYLHCLL